MRRRRHRRGNPNERPWNTAPGVRRRQLAQRCSGLGTRIGVFQRAAWRLAEDARRVGSSFVYAPIARAQHHLAHAVAACEEASRAVYL